MNHLGKETEQPGNRVDYLKAYGSHIESLLGRLDLGAVQRVIDCFLEARRNNKTIFFAGNGGSAATASHFAQDLAEVCKKAGSRCFKTLSLTDNVSLITALGNDYGYDEIFTGQLKNLCNAGDVFVGISASGNSQNVVEAVTMVKKRGGVTVALVGFDGGALAELCDHVVHVVSNKGEYGPVEDIHLVIDHMITSYITWMDLADSGSLSDRPAEAESPPAGKKPAVTNRQR